MDKLNQELRRVLSAPYLTSLKTLSSILSLSPTEALLEWADTYPCQTAPLAAAVLDALAVCPETLQVIQYLGAVPATRDAILAQNPAVLDGLLQNALAKGNNKNFDKFAPACIAFLSTPLPQTVPVPLHVNTFFQRCVDEVAETTPASEDAVRRVYSLVANGYSYMAARLSPNQTVHLHECLGKLLGSNDQCMVMLSLACLACLVMPDAEHADVHTSGLSSGKSTPEPSGTAAGNHRHNPGRQSFFNGSKSVKVLRLVCDNVIASVSKASDDPRTFEILRLSSVIVQAVSEEKKFEFINSSVGKGILKNVLTKLDKLDVPFNILGLVLDFLHYLTPTNVVVPGLQEISEKMLRMARRNEHSIGRYLLPKSYRKYLVSSDSSYLLEALREAYIAACSKNISPSAIAKHIDLLQEIQERIDTSSKLRKSIKTALCTNEFSALLERLLSSDFSSFMERSDDMMETCPANQGKLHKNLRILLCSIPIRLSFHSAHDDCPELNSNLANTLLGKTLQISNEQPRCNCRYPKRSLNGSMLSVVEENSTPSSGVDSKDWRWHLSVELTRNASRNHDLLINSVGEICRDLEARCEDIERPLRAEKDRADTLLKEVEVWKSKLLDAEEAVRSTTMTFEQDCAEKDNQIERLLQEKIMVEGHLDQTLARVDECQSTIDELRGLIDQSKEELNQGRREAEARIDDLIGDHLAQLNERQETIEELKQNNEAKENEVSRLQRVLNDAQGENLQLGQRIQKLDVEVGELGLEVECAKTEVIRKQNSIENLQEQLGARDQALEARNKVVRSLEDEVQNLQDENANLDKTNGLLAAKLEALENEVAEIYLRHEKEFDRANNAARADLSKLQDSHQEELNKLQAQIAKNNIDFATEREKSAKEIKALKLKVKKLDAIREQQAKEFSEAQDLSRRLLAVMNGNAATSLPVISTHAEENSQEIHDGDATDMEEDEVNIEPSPKKTPPTVHFNDLKSTRRQTIAAAPVSTANTQGNNNNKKADRRKKSGKGDIINTPVHSTDRRHSDMPLDSSNSPTSSRGSPTPKRPRNKTTMNRCSLSPKSGKTFKAKGNNNANQLPIGLSSAMGNKRVAASAVKGRQHQLQVEDKENREPTLGQRGGKLARAMSTPLTPSKSMMDVDVENGFDSQFEFDSSGLGGFCTQQQVPGTAASTYPGNRGGTGILDGLSGGDFDDTTLSEL